MNNVIKFPPAACRHIRPKKPRRSKNGVVFMTNAREQARSEVDGSKLRVSPLRSNLAAVVCGATVVGKMHTAGLKGQPLAAFSPETRLEWLETLKGAIEAVESVGMGLVKARHTLKALQSEKRTTDLDELAADKSRVADEFQTARCEIERLFHELAPKLKPVALTWLRHLASSNSA